LDRLALRELLEVLKHFNGISTSRNVLESQLNNGGIEDFNLLYFFLINLAEIIVPLSVFDVKNIVRQILNTL
jgi:hypothetical protein